MLHLVMRELFLNKMLKKCKNISTGDEVMAKIIVACFFLEHGVDRLFWR